MYANLSRKIELFFLDFFIYVLSEIRAVKKIVRIGYHLATDRKLLVSFLFTILVASGVGMSLGLMFSMIIDKLL
jgi:hypothetical protein